MAKKRARVERGASSGATRVLALLTLAGGAVFLVSMAAVVWMVSAADLGVVNESSWIDLQLSGVLVDAPTQGDLLADSQQAPPLVTEFSEALVKAADDDRIEGLFLESGCTN